MVHQLKGVGTGYGFPRITETAAKTEAMIKAISQDAGAPTAGAPSLDSIRTGVEELVAIIRRIDGYDASKEQNGQRANPHR
jgi:hypothetical protein